jgi:hypothetical protein
MTRRPAPKRQRPGQVVLVERLAATTAARPTEPEAKWAQALILRSVEQLMTTKGIVSRSFLKHRELHFLQFKLLSSINFLFMKKL